MAHWAELDENNIVLRVTVGNNNEPDEGYQWLLDNLGGRWIKTSYNTIAGKHILGGTPFRGTFAGIGFYYDEINDRFMSPKPEPSFVFNEELYDWVPPIAPPDSGDWVWNEETLSWVELNE